MRELVQEREARLSLEKQLEGALAENKTCNDQLEALQGEIARLRSTSSSVDSLCDNVESCTRLQVRVKGYNSENFVHSIACTVTLPVFGRYVNSAPQSITEKPMEYHLKVSEVGSCATTLLKEV